jgi:hypothetical protein
MALLAGCAGQQVDLCPVLLGCLLPELGEVDFCCGGDAAGQGDHAVPGEVAGSGVDVVEDSPEEVVRVVGEVRDGVVDLDGEVDAAGEGGRVGGLS